MKKTETMDADSLIAHLNEVAGLRGVGRGIHVGDTILGIKGRIAFEAPGPLRRDTGQLAFDEVEARIGDNRISLAGTLGTPPTMVGIFGSIASKTSRIWS